MIPGDSYGILSRLLLNQPIEPSPEGVLRLLGFVHVYSASGLHLIALESFLQRFFGKSLVTKKILTVCFWFFLFLIWYIQGFRLGFSRILLLFFLRALARTKGFRWRVYYPLFLAFCFDFALGINSGWQHYYLAILGGMVGLEFARHRGTFVQHFYLSLASWLMTAPLDLWLHHTISWMTPLWSMITIPVIALFLYPLSIIAYFLLGRVPAFLVDFWNQGVEFLLPMVNGGLTFSVVNDRFIYFSLGLAIVAGLIFFFLKRNRDRGFFILFCVLFSLVIRAPISYDGVRLVQLNVGQGDSLLITHQRRVEMIDLGTSREVKPESVLLRLAHYGVTHVDTVLFSHLDEDHAGGIRLLLPWVPTQHLEISSRLERTAKVRRWLHDFPRTTWCENGCFKLGVVDWIDSRRSSASAAATAFGNDLMATTMIPLSSRKIYLALGDSNSRQEEVFWSKHRLFVESFPLRILKVSHHGSKYSSSFDFLRKINPIRAVISVGRRNHYHHPHFSVMDRLIREHIPIHRTDRDGDFWLD